MKSPFLRRLIPRWLYYVLAWSGRRQSERRLNSRFPDVERAVARLAPRPWLMIHGGRDTYISPEIARRLFLAGNGPRELWLVADARHNRCRECEPEAYAARLLGFLERFAPRRPLTVSTRATPSLVPSHDELVNGYAGELQAPRLGAQVATPLSDPGSVLVE